MSQNKSVEEVVEEINECIRINSNASICTNCAGGGYDYEESRDCQKCQASGITNWDFDYLNKRLTEIIRQERQTSQEREREIVVNTAKSVNRIATQNGYALAIKHFEERMSKGQAVFEAIEEMKETHKKQSFTNPKD